MDTTINERIEAAARMLTEARQGVTRLADLGEATPETNDEANRMADRHAALLGLDVAGWKIGCTSQEAMDILGSPGPFAGRVFANTIYRDGVADQDAMVDPVAECEFAFILGADISPRDEEYTVTDVKAATEAVAPAVELVAPRFTDMKTVGYRTLIADSGANGGAVLGTPIEISALPDLASVEVRCVVDEEEAGRGFGSAILGDPWLALTWLANHLSGRGLTISAGQFVLSGTCTGIAPVGAGSSVLADYGPLGEVSFVRRSMR